jgi:hypothetical protein
MPDEIEQVDAVLCEDGRTVMLTGHAADDNVTFTASIDLPWTLTEDAFLPSEWASLGQSVEWWRHG